MPDPTPPPSRIRGFLRTYRGPLITSAMIAGYLGWRAWRIHGDDEVFDTDTHLTILLLLAIATNILLNRAARSDSLAEMRAQLRLIHYQVAALTREVAADNLARSLMQGQLEQITTRLDAVTTRVDELHGDAYADGLAARRLRDPKGDPTDAAFPQVSALWLSKEN